jgi:hypothetical protein
MSMDQVLLDWWGREADFGAVEKRRGQRIRLRGG